MQLKSYKQLFIEAITERNMQTIKIELTRQELSEVLMAQLANEVKLGLISKAQAMALFLDHLKQEYNYTPSVNEYPYKNAI